MIISGGENIASSEVERVVYQLPQVSEVAVVGRPDPKWGERPVAVVVLKEGANLDAATFEAHCRANLAGVKVPRELHVVDALPRSEEHPSELQSLMRHSYAVFGLQKKHEVDKYSE